MTAKEYLESKGLCDHDYTDSGMINHISEMMEEYYNYKQMQVKNLHIPVVIKSCDTCKNLSTCRFWAEAPENGKTCKFYIDHVL